ncbi:MAG TPA: SidE phosphodiesterase domain-containing protein [Rhabdochlamydiaceae bacterium]|nr:SidE phosphodiesterase domain-containing protein [Rhabdochlamydiaceae bacterium]
MSLDINFAGVFQSSKTQIISGTVQSTGLNKLLDVIKSQAPKTYEALTKAPFSGKITHSKQDGFKLSLKGGKNVELRIDRHQAVQIAGSEAIDRMAPIPPTNYKTIIGSLAALALAWAVYYYQTLAAVAAAVAVGSCLLTRTSSPALPSTLPRSSFTIQGNPSHGKGPTIPLQIGTVNVGTLTDANFGTVAKIANQYTLNQPYASAPADYFTHKGQFVYRPNHNGSHSARQARTLEALFALVEKEGDASVQSVYRSLSPEEKLHLKLGAYFLRAGRSDESSHKNPNPDDYYTRSAMIYEAYSQQLGATPATIAWVKKLIINSCKPRGIRDRDIDTDPKSKFGYECFTMVHELDLIRCFGATSYDKSLAHVKDELDHYFLKKPALKADQTLLDFAKKLCDATGSRRTYDGASGNTDLFARCGVDGKFCWQQVQAVKLPF